MKKYFIAGLVTMFVLVGIGGFSVAAVSGSWNKWDLFVKKHVAIGVQSGITDRLTVKGDGTNDIASFQNSSGTEVFNVDIDGDLTAKTITSSGGLTGTTVTASSVASISGGATFGSSVKPASVTADPCAASPYVPGSIFYNATSNYMCFCDGSSADLKMNDNSTACF